jgi:4-amino-4-deoxy-L-arabinose transferase-like glycosyltransferase
MAEATPIDCGMAAATEPTPPPAAPPLHPPANSRSNGQVTTQLKQRLAKPTLTALAALLTLTAIRLVVAARMPLSADEAYYRVWAHALAPGYLDHPPMVAIWIRAGITLAGDNTFGVRLLAPFATLAGSLLLWRAGEDLAPNQSTGLRAAGLLNATLLLNAGAVLITPDTPLLLFWMACLASLARLIRTGNALWWLAAGASAGLAFDSKYTAALLAPIALLWLLAVPAMRFWLGRWQPYAGAALALALATPVLAWNAAHHWASFIRQGGRTTDWHPAEAIRHLLEFIAGQIGLATPLLFAVFVIGVAACARRQRWHEPAPALLAASCLVPLAVFLQHAFGDRVQANWLAPAYPGAALAAALVPIPGRAVAAALGLLMSAAVYIQAAWAPFALPRRIDFSLIRLAGWDDLARAADTARQAANADCLAADEYGLAAALAFRLRTSVLGAEPRWALFDLPPAPADCRIVLLVRSTRRASATASVGQAERARSGVVAETYNFYREQTPANAVLLPGKE